MFRPVTNVKVAMTISNIEMEEKFETVTPFFHFSFISRPLKINYNFEPDVAKFLI